MEGPASAGVRELVLSLDRMGVEDGPLLAPGSGP